MLRYSALNKTYRDADPCPICGIMYRGHRSRWSKRLCLLTLLSWVCILLGSASASRPAVYENQKGDSVDVYQKSQQGRTARRDNVTVSQRPFNDSSHQKPNSEQPDAQQSWWQTPQWVVVFITAVYALFSGLQWWSMRNLVSMDRPWIFVGYVNLLNPLGPNAPVVVNYVWTNNGRTLAVLFEQNAELRLVESLPQRPRYNTAMTIGGAGILNPSISSPVFSATLPAPPPSDLAQINTGQKKLYWLGYLIYEDAIRKRHTYRFCFRYFPNRFVPDGPKAYNWRD